ncbi:MAG: PfkB family carbohydrate kinase [Candidatus Manganitrophus sp.]|nr:PfkB family carbohydrate kinase [Candidatus Manganitrophus morganii]MDC4204750.1 PfkB family carbohydrate kinase [Candidatus Manganitrophus sp.]MCG3116878.1 PfkB family carbohydrate kinase [Candidatus Manganitrophus morganii]MDC4223759.1 PfkB family carbohydrate kinase [Candidatus Manganitrophus sp.]WDT69652.1 MAG: PfkB family carbohydrate kinase [Candidatus Manganitrophus sp.]
MSLLVVGSVAFDSVKTPFGEAKEVLGGSATYFSTAASYFTEVKLVAVVGEDFPESHLAFLKEKGVDFEGLERRPGRTFRWRGEYGYQLNEAKTLDTQLNVFESFRPKLPSSYRDASVVFLANIDPELQLDVLKQVKQPKLVACDTMNFWIGGKRDALIKTLGEVDILIINDGEARELAGEFNLVKVAKKILSFGPKILIIKRGEYGALMFNGQTTFAAPALPLENVFDPTGAGDSFAGGFMGYLSQNGTMNEAALRQAVIYGSVMASFNVEAFSLDRMRTLTREEINARYKEFQSLTFFESA